MAGGFRVLAGCGRDQHIMRRDAAMETPNKAQERPDFTACQGLGPSLAQVLGSVTPR
jgi:hypothetical protein